MGQLREDNIKHEAEPILAPSIEERGKQNHPIKYKIFINLFYFPTKALK